MTGTKVFVMPGGMMKSNGSLVDLIEKVKPEIRTLIEKCNTVSNVFHNPPMLFYFQALHLQMREIMYKCMVNNGVCSSSAPLQVKMWVQLLIPRIEDGNNFGVSIQEETVAELRTVEGEAASYLDQISRYEEVLTILYINKV